MKKSILFLLIVFFIALPILAQAQGTFKGLFTAPGKAKAVAQQPTLKFVFDGTLPFNMNGDTLFLIEDKSFGGGIGIDLATYKGIVSLRAEASAVAEGSNAFTGAGLSVNIPSLLNLIPGMNWNATYINPSFSVVPGYNFGKEKYSTGLVLSILQVTF